MWGGGTIRCHNAQKFHVPQKPPELQNWVLKHQCSGTANVRDKCHLQSCCGYSEITISNCMMRMDRTSDSDRYMSVEKKPGSTIEVDRQQRVKYEQQLNCNINFVCKGLPTTDR